MHVNTVSRNANNGNFKYNVINKTHLYNVQNKAAPCELLIDLGIYSRIILTLKF